MPDAQRTEDKERLRERRESMRRQREELLATPQTDPVREYCRRRGYADRVILGGLTGLIERWEYAVSKIVESDSQHLIEEYQNELDGRSIIEEVLPLAMQKERQSIHERLNIADSRFRAASVARDECVWGERVAARRGYTPATHWWYYRWPRVIGLGWHGFPPVDEQS